MRLALAAITTTKTGDRHGHVRQPAIALNKIAFRAVQPAEDVDDPARNRQMIHMPTQDLVAAQMAANPRRQAARSPGTAAIDVVSRIKDGTAQAFNGQGQLSRQPDQKGVGARALRYIESCGHHGPAPAQVELFRPFHCVQKNIQNDTGRFLNQNHVVVDNNPLRSTRRGGQDVQQTLGQIPLCQSRR